ncbi:MAG: ArsA family ATPase [Chloroflexi bacterium]|nr:ArsA family ATPase [Chloroflexota bacterium]
MSGSKKSSPPRWAKVTMFSGKGGVGKTTCAAATALHYASHGQSTLALSTDATPSLSHIFELPGEEKPKKVNESLYINELGEAEVARMWDDKFGRDVYDVFATFVDVDYQQFVDFTTSVLPGLRDEFMVDYIRELSLKNNYENIIWDTAPLGQTLALLNTPGMLVEHLKMAPRIYTRLKLSRVNKEPILNIINRWRKLSSEEINFLRNNVRFVLVTIPEALAVEQLDSVFLQLERHGLIVDQLIVNNVIKADGSEFLKAKARLQKKYLDFIHKRYQDIEITEVPMFPYELKGWDRLKEVERILFPNSTKAGC